MPYRPHRLHGWKPRDLPAVFASVDRNPDVSPSHRLTTYREIANFYASEVALALGVARSTLSRWESGSRDVPRMVLLIARGLAMEALGSPQVITYKALLDVGYHRNLSVLHGEDPRGDRASESEK